MDLSGVNKLVVTACSFSESRVLDELFVFHSGLKLTRKGLVSKFEESMAKKQILAQDELRFQHLHVAL